MIELKENDIQKLSEITEIPCHDIQKLYTMGLIHEANALNYLIKHDFDSIKKMGQYRTFHIVRRICNKYHVSKTKVHNAIYQKRSAYFYCGNCDKRIGKSEYVRNNGLCDDCVSMSIDL